MKTTGLGVMKVIFWRPRDLVPKLLDRPVLEVKYPALVTLVEGSNMAPVMGSVFVSQKRVKAVTGA